MHHIIIVIAKYFIVIPAIAWAWLAIDLPRGQRRRFLLRTLAAAVLTAVLVKLGTTIHQDPRPFLRDHVQPYFVSSIDNGFPSDHTAFATLLAWLVLPYRRTWGIALLVVAILIGAARVISHVHHVQDIVGGFLLATIAVGLVLAVDRFFSQRRSRSATTSS